MKTIRILIILILLVELSSPTYSQKKTTPKKEISNVYGNNWHAEKCHDSNGNIMEDCIDRMTITFTNDSKKTLKEITFTLEIVNVDGNMLYNGKHTVSVDIKPGATGVCKEFKLSKHAYNNTTFDDNSTFNVIIDVIGVK